MKLSRRLFMQSTLWGLAGTAAFGFDFSFGKKPQKIENTGKSLVIFFSQTGTTQYLAQVIQHKVGADIFEVVPDKPYVGTYKELKRIAQKEQDIRYRPALSNLPDVTAYDTIFVGFPTWLYTMPMVMFTMFDKVDFSGKTIIPFNTHGGTGFSSSLKHMRQVAPKATIVEGIEILDEDLQYSSKEINSWLKDLGFNV